MDVVDTTFEAVPEEIRNLLVRIKAELPNRKPISFDFRPLTDISYDNLERQLETTPSNFAFWGMVFAEQKMCTATLELHVKKRKAELSDAILKKAKEEGVMLRRSDIADMIDSDGTYLRIRAKLIVSERSLAKLQLLLEAIRMKSEHLRSLAGFKRQELRDA